MATSDTEDRRTSAQRAYVAIRQLIIDRELHEGQKMVVRPLSERLGLSATPIKSALAALERDGLLQAVPRRGYFVHQISDQDMREIYELREVLDGIAARNAASRSDADTWVTSVLRPLFVRQRDHDQDDRQAYSDADIAFHGAIWHASGNTRLQQVTDNLGGQLRFASGSSSQVPGRIVQALAEHESIMDAIAQGDHRRAERESRAHVRRSATAFRASRRQSHGDGPTG